MLPSLFGLQNCKFLCRYLFCTNSRIMAPGLYFLDPLSPCILFPSIPSSSSCCCCFFYFCLVRRFSSRQHFTQLTGRNKSAKKDLEARVGREPGGGGVTCGPIAVPCVATQHYKNSLADYFSRNFVCILRTTTSRHMVSFTDLYFHFLANFQT